MNPCLSTQEIHTESWANWGFSNAGFPKFWLISIYSSVHQTSNPASSSCSLPPDQAKPTQLVMTHLQGNPGNIIHSCLLTRGALQEMGKHWWEDTSLYLLFHDHSCRCSSSLMLTLSIFIDSGANSSKHILYVQQCYSCCFRTSCSSTWRIASLWIMDAWMRTGYKSFWLIYVSLWMWILTVTFSICGKVLSTIKRLVLLLMQYTHFHPSQIGPLSSLWDFYLDYTSLNTAESNYQSLFYMESEITAVRIKYTIYISSHQLSYFSSTILLPH